MKTLLTTTIAILLLATNAQAQYGNYNNYPAPNQQPQHSMGMVTIQHQHNNPIFVLLDNQMSYGPSTKVVINRVRPGQHCIKIMQNNRSHHHNAVRQIIYEGYININSRQNMSFVVNNFGQLTAMQQYPNPCQQGYSPPQCPGNNGYPNNHSANCMCNACHANTYPQNNGWGNNHHYNNNPNNDYDNDDYNDYEPIETPQYQYSNMHPNAFNALKQQINTQKFDDTKLQIATQAVTNQKVSSQQISEILPLFSFESNKLKFAKAAFSNVSDPQNYFMLYSNFSFDSSVKDLSNYVSMR